MHEVLGNGRFNFPPHWRRGRVKDFVHFTTGWTPPSDEDRFYGTGYPWANIGDLGPRVLHQTSREITEAAVEEARANPVPAGSLLFAFKLSVGAVSFAGRPMFTNEAIAAFLASPDLSLRYWYYAAPVFVPLNGRENIYGALLLNDQLIREAEIALPPLREQEELADLLDRRLAAIDALVEDKRRALSLLHEQRLAVITQAVGRGLDLNVRMKATGVEWLQEIPERWSARRLKFAVPGVTVGIVVTPSKYYVDSGVPCLRSLNVAGGTVRMEDLVWISPEANDLHGKSKIWQGDIVVVRTGQAGAAAIVPPELHGANCIDLLIIRKSQRLDTRFLWYFLSSWVARVQVEAHSVGAIQAHYNTSTLADLIVPMPPLPEQRAIADSLDAAVGALDSLKQKVENGIALLNEYRTALITAAVTGRLNLRAA